MIRKVIGAALGAKLVKSSPAMGGAAGTVIATALPFVLSRLALPGLATIGAGAFVLNRYRKQRAAAPDEAATRVEREPVKTGRDNRTAPTG